MCEVQNEDLECKGNLLRRSTERFREHKVRRYRIDFMAVWEAKQKKDFVVVLKNYIFFTSENKEIYFWTENSLKKKVSLLRCRKGYVANK